MQNERNEESEVLVASDSRFGAGHIRRNQRRVVIKRRSISPSGIVK